MVEQRVVRLGRAAAGDALDLAQPRRVAAGVARPLGHVRGGVGGADEATGAVELARRGRAAPVHAARHEAAPIVLVRARDPRVGRAEQEVLLLPQPAHGVERDQAPREHGVRVGRRVPPRGLGRVPGLVVDERPVVAERIRRPRAAVEPVVEVRRRPRPRVDVLGEVSVGVEVERLGRRHVRCRARIGHPAPREVALVVGDLDDRAPPFEAPRQVVRVVLDERLPDGRRVDRLLDEIYVVGRRVLEPRVPPGHGRARPAPVPVDVLHALADHVQRRVVLVPRLVAERAHDLRDVAVALDREVGDVQARVHDAREMPGVGPVVVRGEREPARDVVDLLPEQKPLARAGGEVLVRRAAPGAVHERGDAAGGAVVLERLRHAGRARQVGERRELHERRPALRVERRVGDPAARVDVLRGPVVLRRVVGPAVDHVRGVVVGQGHRGLAPPLGRELRGVEGPADAVPARPRDGGRPPGGIDGPRGDVVALARAHVAVRPLRALGPGQRRSVPLPDPLVAGAVGHGHAPVRRVGVVERDRPVADDLPRHAVRRVVLGAHRSHAAPVEGGDEVPFERRRRDTGRVAELERDALRERRRGGTVDRKEAGADVVAQRPHGAVRRRDRAQAAGPGVVPERVRAAAGVHRRGAPSGGVVDEVDAVPVPVLEPVETPVRVAPLRPRGRCPHECRAISGERVHAAQRRGPAGAVPRPRPLDPVLREDAERAVGQFRPRHVEEGGPAEALEAVPPRTRPVREPDLEGEGPLRPCEGDGARQAAVVERDVEPVARGVPGERLHVAGGRAGARRRRSAVGVARGQRERRGVGRVGDPVGIAVGEERIGPLEEQFPPVVPAVGVGVGRGRGRAERGLEVVREPVAVRVRGERHRCAESDQGRGRKARGRPTALRQAADAPGHGGPPSNFRRPPRTGRCAVGQDPRYDAPSRGTDFRFSREGASARVGESGHEI